MKDTSINGKFSFVNVPIMNIAKNVYLPQSLQEVAITSSNLSLVGNNTKTVIGAGLSFNYKDAYLSAFGEFCERYSCSFQNSGGLIYGTYENLKKEYSCYDIETVKYYTKEQYNNPDFIFNKINVHKPIYWKWCTDFINDEPILMPYFMVGLENIVGDGLYHYNTSTGSSAHNSIPNALLGGFLECIERDAFCKFWYLQNYKKHNKLSSDFIQSKYPNNEKIQSIYNNKKIKIVTFNLCDFSYTPTFVTFIFFKDKGKLLQSVGSASRLNIEDALLKSCLEAYQGIQYAKMCSEKYYDMLKDIEDFSIINEFDKHFAFYNINPSLREESSIIREALNWENNYTNEIEEIYPNHIKELSTKELKRAGITQFYFTEMTTPDVKELNIDVVKIIMPELHLLTGNFSYPYLGLFEDSSSLFLKYPHPFP